MERQRQGEIQTERHRCEMSGDRQIDKERYIQRDTEVRCREIGREIRRDS